ncbi:hypothetical protein A2G96_12060 [Cupriavidus nantongensis]|uniref:Uncharacterized protein n=1 Tax=Cupriavidus nantongensis TaxID=1796606 RepID=A0A142JJZ8_9BURK|nr:hypothetical protein A2G96_12060 [Cupriavidus nantongensis]
MGAIRSNRHAEHNVQAGHPQHRSAQGGRERWIMNEQATGSRSLEMVDQADRKQAYGFVGKSQGARVIHGGNAWFNDLG